MLQLKNITKTYSAGDFRQTALDGISVNFRENEFVAVLGHSGSGKTTMLNIIGGLDRYDSGRLVINGIPTDKYRDCDWDTYRNHSIGFVFQSYNLIPHQSVLSNVELALTLSGVSKKERRRRAAEALDKVGLSEQMRKRPSQLSGGQMQRVAIARAIVNDPDILLADEPTGALDSETSVQIMEILRQIARDRLIIMVTHNPELAQKYATRTIKLKDGTIVGDSDPYEVDDSQTPELTAKQARIALKTGQGENVKKGKKSMSVFTALSLSFNNLRTKKGRTFMTSFAGSIGIIGIALIMALSNGIQLYINRVQQDTLSSYPISIQKETYDMSSLITTVTGASDDDDEESEHDLDAVYENRIMYDLVNAMLNIETNENNLKAFKAFLDKEMNPETSTTSLYEYATIKYSYDMVPDFYTEDIDGNIVRSDYNSALARIISGTGSSSSFSQFSSYSSYSSAGSTWEEMLPGDGDELISDLLKTQYEVVSGRWPESANEVVLLVSKNNEVSDMALYALGLRTEAELRDAFMQIMRGQTIEGEESSWQYDEIVGKKFRVIPACDRYVAGDGEFSDIASSEFGIQTLYSNGMEIELVGIIRQSEDAVSGMLNGVICYTSALTDNVVAYTSENEIVKRQLADETTDALTGKRFATDDEKSITDSDKIAAAEEYIATISDAEKANIYTQLASIPSDEYVAGMVEQTMANMTREIIEQSILSEHPEYADMIGNMDDATLMQYVSASVESQIREQYSAKVAEGLAQMPVSQLAAMLSHESGILTDKNLLYIYDEFVPSLISDSTFEKNMKRLGYVTLDNPASISIYADTFADKDVIADIIDDYNDSADETDKIEYTDYVKLLMSSITTIINVISYVLIAFVAISLVVSSIMIGIITYISVLERTKEIGILRSIGASKRDVSRVFNAETSIIGLCAGGIGIGATLLLCLPINAIIRALSGISNIGAVLPVEGAIVLVIISVGLTFIAGLIPASVAAKKDPVSALRTE